MTDKDPNYSTQLEENIGFAIRDIGIPPRPTVLTEVESEMAKSEPDFSHLGRVISADVALSAALLKTTNSPYFGLDRKVRSVSEALLLLGLKLAIRTIAGISLRKTFERTPNMERFWDQSGTTARVCGWLAKALRKNCYVRPEDAYTFGLFRDCGIPVIMAPFPQYRSVLMEANAESRERFTDVENRLVGANHADMGAMLSESWSLPAEITDAIRYHHHLDQLAEGLYPDASAAATPLIALAALAEYLILRRTGVRENFEWEKVHAMVRLVLHVNDAMIEELFLECHEPMAGYAD